MTLEQFNDFKEKAKKFYLALEPLMRDVWDDDNKTTLLGVLLQNVQFNSKDTSEFDLKKEVEKLNKQLRAIESLAEYENYHLYNYVCSELNMIHTSIIINHDDFQTA